MIEKKKIESKLLDSSIWLSYLLNEKYIEIVEKEEKLFLSVISLFEIEKKLLKSSLDKKKIDESIVFIKSKSIILPLTEKIADKAALISVERNIPSMDSLIYATALINEKIVYSEDNDFRGLDNAVVFDK